MTDNLKKTGNLSFWLILPLLWYFATTTKDIYYGLGSAPLDPTNIDYLEGSPLARYTYASLMLAGFFVLLARRVRWGKIISSNKYFVALLVYMLLSVAWSDFSEVALKRWIKCAGSFIMALVVLTEYQQFKALLSVLRRFFLIHLPLDLITIRYFRNIGVEWSKNGLYPMWTGITTHKNLLGQICMTSGIYFLCDLLKNNNFKRNLVDVFYLVLTIFLMNGPGYSRSTTALSVLLFGIIILFLLRSLRKKPGSASNVVAFGSVVAILLMVFGFLIIDTFASNSTISEIALNSMGKDETLTGRTQLWTDIINIASNNPWFGVGYGSFWIGDKANNLWENHPWRPGQGHNGYIDVYVELGVFGVLLLSVFLVSSFKNIREMLEQDFEYGSFRMTLFAMILVHNIAESSFLRSNHNIWFVFLLIALNVPSEPTMNKFNSNNRLAVDAG